MRRLALLVAWAVGLCLLDYAPACLADNIAVVLSEDTPAYNEVVDTLRRNLERDAPGRFKIFSVPAKMINAKDQDIFKSDHYQLVITVGVRAAVVMIEIGAKAPLWHTLIPKAVYEKAMESSAQKVDYRLCSAIYVEQPLLRQLELVRELLPGRLRLAVLYGPDSAASARALEKVANGLGLQVEGETIARSDELAPALQRVLQRGELLFALPDPEVYNKTTLHNILLSTYHSNEPVIAFSPAYVKAGALAAVFSSPLQVARQVSEYLLQIPAGARIELPPPQHPKHFSVDVNRHVARSLGIVVASDAMLEERLRKADEARP